MPQRCQWIVKHITDEHRQLALGVSLTVENSPALRCYWLASSLSPLRSLSWLPSLAVFVDCLAGCSFALSFALSFFGFLWLAFLLSASLFMRCLPLRHPSILPIVPSILPMVINLHKDFHKDGHYDVYALESRRHCTLGNCHENFSLACRLNQNSYGKWWEAIANLHIVSDGW